MVMVASQQNPTMAKWCDCTDNDHIKKAINIKYLLWYSSHVFVHPNNFLQSIAK